MKLYIEKYIIHKKPEKTAIIQGNFSTKKHEKRKSTATVHTKFDFKYAYGGYATPGGGA